MDVDDYMGMNVIGKLGKPRMNLIKAICREKYGQRYWNANEMMAVIHENKLSLFHEGKDRTEKQIADAMKVAYEKLKTQ